jgi:hypothetical protein
MGRANDARCLKRVDAHVRAMLHADCGETEGGEESARFMIALEIARVR